MTPAQFDPVAVAMVRAWLLVLAWPRIVDVAVCSWWRSTPPRMAGTPRPAAACRASAGAVCANTHCVRHHTLRATA